MSTIIQQSDLQTFYGKNIRGEYSGQTDLNLSTIKPNMSGNIRTYKSGKSIETSIQVGISKDESDGFKSFTFIMFGDFRKTLSRTPCNRVTSKLIDIQHNEQTQLDNLTGLVEEIKTFYANKTA